MEKYIYEYNSSIPDILCDEIISLYETEEGRYPGVTASGVNPLIKHTTDFVIPKSSPKWNEIEQFLYKELSRHLKHYLDDITKSEYFSPEHNNGRDTTKNFLKGQQLQVDHFMVQKYKQNEGMYIYHDDYSVEYDKKRFRVITYLWYLNDVYEGGETEFWGSYTIKPKKGKLILFPSFWCFPHRAKVPISSDKVIITG
jgi:2OG-Fe(II) oxygenase superfamily